MTPDEIAAELEAMNAELNAVLHRYVAKFDGQMTAVAVVIRTPRGFGVFSPESHGYLCKAFAELAELYNGGHRPYAAVPAREKGRRQ